MSGERVLVTGGSGFVGVHCILALLNAGYRVRTTVRSRYREPDVRAMLAKGGAEPGDALEFHIADLTSDEGWADAAVGCTYVLHVASPFPSGEPKDANELIIPARDGALRVLKAARDAGVKRVVMTSSFAAIGYGTEKLTRPYTEDDWTDPTTDVSAYVKSKTIAERAAWDFITSEGADRDGKALELAVVNPVVILGPALGTDTSTSISLVTQLLKGAAPGLPNLSFGIVDVRDVADLHVLAMTSPAANGERFLATSDVLLTVPQMADILRERLGDLGRKIPKRALPNWVLRLAATVVPPLREFTRRLDNHREVSNAKAKTLLGWSPRPNEEFLVDTARSLVELKLVQAGSKA